MVVGCNCSRKRKIRTDPQVMDFAYLDRKSKRMMAKLPRVEFENVLSKTNVTVAILLGKLLMFLFPPVRSKYYVWIRF